MPRNDDDDSKCIVRESNAHATIERTNERTNASLFDATSHDESLRRRRWIRHESRRRVRFRRRVGVVVAEREPDASNRQAVE